ncbi:MAG: MFS transporter [Candidatus Thorarchaeota archaeon]|nr:MFS transporter [Candidatus Thorarchaeota archaeon]
MSQEPVSELSSEETEKALSKMVGQGAAVQIRTTLTESVFLVAFAILLGAPNSVIGILAAIPSLTQFLQMPAVILIQKYRNRRNLNLLTQLGNRLGVLLLALIPFISTSEIGLVLLLGSITIQSIFTALGAPSWNSWLRDLVPQDRLGSFFAKRMAIMGIVGILASLLGGFFIGVWSSANPDDIVSGYSIIFFLAFIAGMTALYYTSTTPEPPLHTTQEKLGYSDLMAKPFQNTNYRNLMWFTAIWGFSTGLAAPFFTVYLLLRLGLAVPLVAALAALTQLTSVIFFRFWGRLSDRFSNKSILQVTVPVFMLGTLLWTFSSIAVDYGFVVHLLVMIHILTGFSAAGVNLSSNNIGLKIAPRGESSVYLAAKGVVAAFTGTIAPILAGTLADVFNLYELSFSITWTGPHGVTIIDTYRLMGLDFIFIFSVLLGLLALYRLAYIKEEGEVEEKVVLEAIIAETRRNVRTISTIDGLRHTFQTPMKLTKKAVKRKRRAKQLSDGAEPTTSKEHQKQGNRKGEPS